MLNFFQLKSSAFDKLTLSVFRRLILYLTSPFMPPNLFSPRTFAFITENRE